MRDETAIVKDGKDLFWKGWKVICITFVRHFPRFKIDRDRIALSYLINPIFKLDHRKAIIDRVTKEDAREGFGDNSSYTSGL